MKQGIIIVTNNRSKEECINCIQSIHSTLYPILIYTNDYNNTGFETDSIKYVLEHTDWEEFLVVQDTIEFKDIGVIHKAFEGYKGESVFFQPDGMSFFNKYRRVILERMKIPDTKTKMQSVEAESNLHKEYKKLEPKTVTLFPELIDCDKRINKFGKERMLIENECVIKYKGVWNRQMTKEYDEKWKR